MRPRFNALRALLRVELRDLARNRWRSLLVLLLIAVPVAALSGAGTLVHTMSPTLEERARSTFGQADLRVDRASPETLAAAARFDAQTTALASRLIQVELRGVRVAAIEVTVDAEGATERLPLGLATGRYALLEGEWPTAPQELALAPAVEDALGAEIGETLTLGGQARRVVGRFVDPENCADALVLTRGAAAARPSPTLLLAADEARPTADALMAAGAGVQLRDGLRAPDGFEELVLFVVGGLGFVEAALVIAAAFAVGVRRRQRELGLLAAGGAPSELLPLGLMFGPLVLAIVGAAVGVAVALSAAGVMHPWLDGWNQRLNGPLEVSWLHVGGACALAVVTAVAAAWIPIRSALRLSVSVALSGRRPATGSARAWMAAGLVLLALGAAVLALGTRVDGTINGALILLGSVLGVLGLGGLSPWVLQVASRLVGALPFAARLAVRDAGRFRTRNAPVVTAVLAGLSAALLIASLLASVEDYLGDPLPNLADDQVLLEGPGASQAAEGLVATTNGEARGRLAAAWHEGDRVWVRPTEDEGGGPIRLFVDVAGADLLGVLELGHLAESELALWIRAQERTADMPDTVQLCSRNALLAELPLRVTGEAAPTRTPMAFVTEATASVHGIVGGPHSTRRTHPWLVRLDRPLVREHFEQLRAQVASHPGTTLDAELLRGSPTGGVLFAALLASMGTGLLVVFIATALSSVESSADARALDALGAPPRSLRRIAGLRAAYLAGLGAVLAIPGGLLPGWGLVALADVPLDFAPPWKALALVTVGMPLSAYVGALGAAALRRLPTAADAL